MTAHAHVHVYAPRGTYLSQTRRVGARKWLTLPGTSKTARKAMVKAVQGMTNGDFRARVLFVTEWQNPMVVMEAKWLR
jgi:hypothetical protein